MKVFDRSESRKSKRKKKMSGRRRRNATGCGRCDDRATDALGEKQARLGDAASVTVTVSLRGLSFARNMCYLWKVDRWTERRLKLHLM